jgi:hypothetical protein
LPTTSPASASRALLVGPGYRRQTHLHLRENNLFMNLLRFLIVFNFSFIFTVCSTYKYLLNSRGFSSQHHDDPSHEHQLHDYLVGRQTYRLHQELK